MDESMQFECWKIVQKVSGYLCSMVANVHGISVTYQIGEWTLPNPLASVYGAWDGLLAFGSRIEAKRYCYACGGGLLGLLVYRAVGVGLMDASQYPMLTWAWGDSRKIVLGDPSIEKWPAGTVMYKKIMLLDGPVSLRGMSMRNV